MTEYDYGKWERDLPFPLQDAEFSEYVEPALGEVTVTSPDWFNPDEPDEVVEFAVRMSLSQFTAIASAIDVGRDIAFGERSFELWRTWCKALIGEITVNCEDVADCFESEIVTNQTLINSVTNAVNSNGFGNPNHINAQLTTVLDRNPSGYQNEPIKVLENCNRDALWGGIRHGIVARLDDNARDMLEDLTAIANAAERLTVFIDIVPVIGDLVEALAFQITEIIPDMLDLFNAASDEDLLDEIACDLFDMVCADCRYPTFDEIAQYYVGRGLAGLPNMVDATFEEVCELLLEIITEPANIAYFTIGFWQLLVLNFNAAFNGSNGTSAIIHWAELGEDFASDNWQDLCDGCGEEYVKWEWDFTTMGQGNWFRAAAFTSAPIGTFIAGKGWRLDNTSGGQVAVIGMPFDTDWQVRGYALKFSYPSSDISANRVEFRANAGAAGTEVTNGGTTVPEGYTRCREGLVSITGYQEFAMRQAVGNQDVQRYIEKVLILFNKGHAPVGNSTLTDDVTPCG